MGESALQLPRNADDDGDGGMRGSIIKATGSRLLMHWIDAISTKPFPLVESNSPRSVCRRGLPETHLSCFRLLILAGWRGTSSYVLGTKTPSTHFVVLIEILP